MISRKRFCIVAAAAALAVAVPILATVAVAADPVAMAFADREVVPVDVTTIEIVNGDKSPTEYPYVTNRAPVPYDQAIRAWAAQRFSATGATPNRMRVTLRRGTITEKLLPVTKGISGWFKKEQGAEYAAVLEVDVAILGADGQVITQGDGRSSATETVREDAKTADRENAWASVTKKTFDDLDAELIPRLRQTMTTYVH